MRFGVPLFLFQWGQETRCISLDLLARIVVGSANKNVGRPPFGFFFHYHRYRDGGLERLFFRLDLIEGLLRCRQFFVECLFLRIVRSLFDTLFDLVKLCSRVFDATVNLLQFLFLRSVARLT